jgi:hypothetical protein
MLVLDENLLLGLFMIIFIVIFYLIHQINCLKNNLKNIENFDTGTDTAITNLGLLANSLLTTSGLLTIPASGIKIGSTQINADGSANFGTVKITTDGTIWIGKYQIYQDAQSGALTFWNNTGGSMNFVTPVKIGPTTQINPDGSALIGKFKINTDGSINIGKYQIYQDTANGGLTFWNGGGGFLNVASPMTTKEIKATAFTTIT